jgi:hypothetical protein
LVTSESCVLRVTAKLGRKPLGKLVKSVAAGGASTQKLKLTKKGLKALKRALGGKKVVRVTFVMICVDAAGNASKANKKVKVRR